MIDCKHWRENPLTKQAGICEGGFWPAPSLGICRNHCVHRVPDPEKLSAYLERHKDDPPEGDDPHKAITIDQLAEAMPPAAPDPIPRDQWGKIANWFSARSIPQDKGLGDVVERLIEHHRLSRYAKRLLKLLPLDCGCNDRRDRLNGIYPLPAGNDG